MKKWTSFTSSEKNAGSLAVRSMSDKAQRQYYGTGTEIGIAAYPDLDEEGEEVARYAIYDFGQITFGLTFDQAQTYLEELYDAYSED